MICLQIWLSYIVVTCLSLIRHYQKALYHCMGVFLLDTGFQYSHACKKLASLVINNFVQKKESVNAVQCARPYKYIIHQANC